MGLHKRSHLTKDIVKGKIDKNEVKRENKSYNLFLLVSTPGLIISIFLGTILLGISFEYLLLVFGIFLFNLGIVLLFHENRDNLIRLSLVFIISGLTFILTETIQFQYIAVLLLGIPVSLYIDNRSRKYLYFPTIIFVGIASYLFIIFDHYILSWLSLLPLVFFYYQSRYKVSSKATYIDQPSAYQLRNQKEQTKNFY